MFLPGVSTRKVKAVTEGLCGHEFSSATIRRMVQQLDGGWRSSRSGGRRRLIRSRSRTRATRRYGKAGRCAAKRY